MAQRKLVRCALSNLSHAPNPSSGKGRFLRLGITVTRSFECPRCSRRYPAISEYRRCVVCRDADEMPLDTMHSDTMPTHDHGKARKLRDQYREFDRRYLLHQERRKRLGFGNPDAIGAMEGRKAAKQLRELEELVNAPEAA